MSQSPLSHFAASGTPEPSVIWPPQIRKPDFFIVGAPKCGTTALYSYLRNHPEVFMPPIKEPQYFAEDTISDPQAIRSFGDYVELFSEAKCERRVGEASTAYLSSLCAPRRIKSLSPSARIIINLRNPVDMMYSLHGTLFYGGVETIANFEAALEQDEREKEGGPRIPGRRVDPPYREMAKFSTQVERYFGVFGRERVHIIIFDDLKADPSSVYRNVLLFLNVSLDFKPRFSVVNPSVRARSKTIQRFLQKPPKIVRGLTHAMVPLAARKLIGNSLLRLNESPLPAIDTSVRSRLVTEFVHEIQTVSQLVGRDLSGWTTTA